MASRPLRKGNRKPFIELLVLPYASAAGRSLLHVLIEELNGGKWSSFHAAVAFVKSTGNFPDFVKALSDFAQKGNQVELTFGADTFSGETKGSDLEAVDQLVEELAELPSAKIYLYHEKGRTFHPKMYLFSERRIRPLLMLLTKRCSMWGKFLWRGQKSETSSFPHSPRFRY